MTSFEPFGIFKKIADDPDGKMTDYSSKDFNSGWYTNVGVALCFTILTSSISTNIDIISKLGRILFSRLKDRGYKRNLKKDVEDEDDD